MSKKSDIFRMIEKSQAMRTEMKLLKTSKKVARYLELDANRKSIHSEMYDHIQQYGVKPENYKKDGLIASKKSWVVVKEVEALAEDHPTIKEAILALIKSKMAYYTL